MSPDIDFIEVARIVDKTISKLDHTLTCSELPLVVCIADFRNISVDEKFLNQISKLSESLTIKNEVDADLEEIAKYKGGFLAYVIANESLDDLRNRAIPNDLKYEFFLKVFDLLTAMKVGGGFAQSIEDVKYQLKNHPLYKLRNKEISISSKPNTRRKHHLSF